MSIFVTAAAGTEGALRDELRELGMRVRADRGGVHVEGDRAAAQHVCLHSRIAVRVLLLVGEMGCGDENALYDGIAAFEWERWLDRRRTLAVSAVAKNSRLRHTGFIAQRSKDAIVDRQRRRERARSDVARHDPDVGIFVHLKDDRARVFLDASGGSLHRRGWRARGGGAPLKETLAAAMLRLSGWDRRCPLVDPMCGSGTLAIEADLWARAVPPQPRDRRFGFERWADFDERAAAALEDARAEAHAGVQVEGPECAASDVDPRAAELARENAERAGARVRVDVRPLRDLPPRPRAQLVGNAPYGVRIGADEVFWDDVRELLARLPRWDCALLVPDEPGLRLRPQRPDARHRLRNGDLDCALVVWHAPKG